LDHTRGFNGNPVGIRGNHSPLSGAARWRDVAALLELLAQLHGNIRQIEPHYRFGLVVADPDDNKFCGCAVAAQADFVITEDLHFAALKSAGYKPQPITPNEFIRLHLSPKS
jgi:predicted nucleic acid-binding protein